MGYIKPHSSYELNVIRILARLSSDCIALFKNIMADPSRLDCTNAAI